MRAIGRVWTASTLLLLVGVGLALENWLREAAPSRARVAAWLLLPLLVLEQRVFYLASFPKSIFESRVEQIVARIPPACSSVLVQLSPDRPFYMSQLEGMWAGMLANVPVVNGYTSNFPPGYPDPSQPYRARDVAVWLASRGENRPPCVLGKLVGNP